MSVDDTANVSDKAQEVFKDLSESLAGLNVVSIRHPRKWRGENFTDRQIPIAAVTVDCYNKLEVFKVVGEVASRNHVTTMAKNGYRNSRSEILIYIQLKKK
jgi:hypothetical protein